MARIPKTTAHKLVALEDHAFLLSTALDGLEAGRAAYLRQIAAELRVLVCLSHNTEGLLWRLTDELKVSDEVELHCFGRVDPSDTINEKLDFACLDFATPGNGDPRLPIIPYSLKGIIKEGEAVYSGGIGHTHEKLIKHFSQQMGTAHEDDGISDFLATLNSVKFGSVQPFYRILYADAYLTLLVSERVLEKATAEFGYIRQEPSCFRTRPLPAKMLIQTPISAPTKKTLNDDEGTIAFNIQWDPIFADETRQTLQFHDVDVDSVSVSCKLTPARFFEVEVTGLFISSLSVRKRIELDPVLGIGVAITWKRPVVTFYINGQRVRDFVESGLDIQ